MERMSDQMKQQEDQLRQTEEKLKQQEDQIRQQVAMQDYMATYNIEMHVVMQVRINNIPNIPSI
jgi:predicted  nucleic acid-binding Zn-ribbon protein